MRTEHPITVLHPSKHEIVGYLENVAHDPESAGAPDRYVLVYLPENTATPYATYLVSGAGDCFHGHYMKNRMDALLDLAGRAGLAVKRHPLR